MHELRAFVVATFLLSLLLAGCVDEDLAPSVTILAVTPDSLDPRDDAADDLTIRVSYRDADGDLGEGTATVHDCRVEDLATVFTLPAIASDIAVKEGVAIEGELEIVVPDVGMVELLDDANAPQTCADLGVSAPTTGSAVFCIILTDKAGNSGTGDCTREIEIVTD